MKSSRKHVIGLSMRTSLTLCAIGILLAISSCGSEAFTPEAKRLDAIETFSLSSAQAEIMDAYIEGMNRESPETAFSRRTTRIAGCYAQRIEVADKFDTVHRDYIRDYTAIERDYYPWFARRGISETAAYELGETVKKASNFCHETLGG